MTKTVFDFFDAFLKLYLVQPTDRITVTDLARIAGYHRNTFYSNFRSVDDLFEQLENNVADEIVLRASQVFCDHFHDTDPFFQVLHDFDSWLRLLFERDEDSHFSELLFRKCRPIWKRKYSTETVGIYREIEIEYKLRGAVAALSYYCRHEQQYSLDELYAFLRNLTM